MDLTWLSDLLFNATVSPEIHIAIFGGIVDFFTGESGEQKTNQYVTQHTNTDTTGKTSQETASQQTQTGTQQASGSTQQQQTTTTKLFTPEEEEILRNMLSSLGTQESGVSPEFINAARGAIGAAGDLNTRAAGAEEAISSQIAPIIANARRQGERDIGRGRTQLAGAAGSGLDSGVVAATAEAEADLASRLAALESELAINARGVETDERTRAITALLAGGEAGANLETLGSRTQVGNVAEIANLLRGASAETTTTGEAQTEETVTTEQLTEALQNLFTEYDQQSRTRTAGNTTGLTRSTQRGSLLDLLNGIGGLASP